MKKVFDDNSFKYMKWWHKIFLFFVPMKTVISVDPAIEDDFPAIFIKYKVLNGRRYLYSIETYEPPKNRREVG